VQQQAFYGGTNAKCGELVITAANGKSSIDTVTVTIGGKQPTRVSSSDPLTQGGPGAIQRAIDAAAPGDLIIVPPGTYDEMLLMWKPVRLQGVGAASTILSANTHPAGKLDPWRAQVNCLFGLALNGQPYGPGNPYDPTGTLSCPGTGWKNFTAQPNSPQVDRLPLEGIVGWDATVNGNLAQMLQEPTLMGAYEGAGITILGKGVNVPPGTDIFGTGAEAGFPAGTTLLTTRDCMRRGTNPFPSNFLCNPSSVDGMAITDSSQGGGGILVHAWGHNFQAANNRIYNNTGTMTGGITVGLGEFPEAYLAGADANVIPPGSCQSSFVTDRQLPYCFNLNVNVHHNAVRSNSSIGDELFSATPAGAGGVAFCPGADFYKFQNNFVCGNLSTGDGGGFVHLGFSYNGDIEHNQILFNQSTNPTIPTNGGGIVVMGGPPDGTTPGGLECGTTTDVDCVPGLGDGTGPGLVINANLLMGNAAESGSGGGLRLQNINGTEVVAFPFLPGIWNDVTVTNNIIANNVAGWDGAGVSLLDALKVNIVNNTIMSNDTTASAGVLFNTLGAPLSSGPGPTCTSNCGTTSLPQPAGLVAIQNSAQLVGALPGLVICPAGHAIGTLFNGNCRRFSVPLLSNDVFWQNRAFYIGVGALGSGTENQQNVVSLFNAFTTTQAVSQPKTDATTANGGGIIITGGTGACTSPASFWDIGVRGDTGPANHGSGLKLAPAFSVLTDAGDYGGANNTALNPTVLSQYCNGSRVPPELGSMGYQVPPGIADATVPNPIFSLTPAATVDEGNNWINMSWGPLAEINPLTGAILGNYGPAAGSPVINYIPQSAVTAYGLAPNLDFFSNPRKTNHFVDAGAVEFLSPPTAVASVTGGPLAFGSVVVGTTSGLRTLTLHNTGGASLTNIAVAVTAPFSRPAGGAGGTCTQTLAPGDCTINVVFSPVAVGAAAGTVTITGSVPVTGSPVSLTGTGAAQLMAAAVAPSSLAFGNWATGTTSNARTVTVTNTGNVALTQGAFTFAGGTPQAFSRPPGSAGGNCGATLAVGASCTVNVVFGPATATGFTRSLVVSYAGATITPAEVSLTGTGVATRATVSIKPSPVIITLTGGVRTGTETVTLTNTAPASGAQMTVFSVATSQSPGARHRYMFATGRYAGPDTCTGRTLAPGASCSVTVRFTIVTRARHVKGKGSLTFTDDAQPPSQGRGSQSVALVGVQRGHHRELEPEPGRSAPEAATETGE
jgi:hypothetical protein